VHAAPCSFGLVRLLRLLNPTTSEHFHTANTSEHDTLVGQGWHDEGDVGCIAAADVGCGAVPLRRLHQPGGKHLFTISQAEVTSLVSAGWTDEGTAGWVWAMQ
jgi:hypothetical protein